VLARSKMPGLAVHVGPAPRYDALRRELRALRAAETRRADDVVLWIGQPETTDALRTLAALLPPLQARRATLWFRAHPRDAGYAAGAYAEIFARAREAIEDMTPSSLDECLRRRPRLAITHFSSAAVEAGFWGIPSLSVLLPNAGAGTLARKKGYSPAMVRGGRRVPGNASPELGRNPRAGTRLGRGSAQRDAGV
jgi:hypothetical protein